MLRLKGGLACKLGTAAVLCRLTRCRWNHQRSMPLQAQHDNRKHVAVHRQAINPASYSTMPSLSS